MERDGQGGLAVGHPVGLELDERGSQPVRLDGRGGIHHRRRRALGLLHVRHHRVAAREVVALRAPDPAPGRLDRPRPPLQRHGHRGIETVQILEQVGVRLARRRQERVEDHRLAVQPQVTALRFQFRQREPPVHAAPRRAVPHRARAVDQLGEKAGRFHGSKHLDGRVLGDERAARLDHRPEPPRGRLDLGGEVGRRALPAAPAQPREPGERSGSRAPGDRTEAGPKRPDDVGVEPLHPPAEERGALPLGDGRDVRSVLFRCTCHRIRAPEQMEIEARAWGQPRQQPLPQAQHAVDLLRGAAVHGGGPQPARRDQFARTGQAGVAVVQPPPVRQLLGQRARRLVRPKLLGDPHSPLPRTRKCQGSAAHLPGSNRAGWRDAARSTASIAGSFRPASQPAP